MPAFEAVKASYRALWNGMVIGQSKIPLADKAAQRILAGMSRYKTVERATGVPWWFVGLCHLREGNLNFETYLGNGQSIRRKTTIVPKGHGPFSDFETGAVFALNHMHFSGKPAAWWTLERVMYCLEGFNGYGYRSHGVNSPYLWAGTNRYTKGKYVRDGVFDPSFVDTQLGSMAVLSRMCGLNAEVNHAVNGAPAATAPAELPTPATVPVGPKDVKDLGIMSALLATLTAGWQAFWGSGAIRFAVVALIVAALYWFIARPILRRMSALEGFYAHADDVELGLVGKVRLALKGVKTFLWGRFLAIAGTAAGILQYADVIDFTTTLPPIKGIPATAYVPLVLGPLLAIVNNQLRKATTTPAGQTDLALAPVTEAPPLVPDAEPEVLKKVWPRVKAKRKARKAKAR